MQRFVSFVLVVFVLTIPVFAHPGDTDSKGGHYNRSTGEYHYHHGYQAHKHEDMDGDGVLDCPHDFVDKTGENSVTSSDTSSLSKTAAFAVTYAVTVPESDSDYWNAYRDGYREGLEYGKGITNNEAENEAYANGYRQGYANGKKIIGVCESESLELMIILVALASIVSALAVYLCCRVDRIRLLSEVKAEAERRIRDVESERDRLLAQRETVRAECREQIQAKEDKCVERIAQIESKTRLMIQQCFVDYFDPQRKSIMKFPKDIDFHPWGVSRGIRTTERPFGDFTVYRTPHGKCYHTVRGCCGATIPVCVFEEQIHGVPHCLSCTGYYYEFRKFPDWYRMYKLLLTETYIPDSEEIDEPIQYSAFDDEN